MWGLDNPPWTKKSNRDHFLPSASRAASQLPNNILIFHVRIEYPYTSLRTIHNLVPSRSSSKLHSLHIGHFTIQNVKGDQCTHDMETLQSYGTWIDIK